jgi:hypothetical protein
VKYDTHRKQPLGGRVKTIRPALLYIGAFAPEHVWRQISGRLPAGLKNQFTTAREAPLFRQGECLGPRPDKAEFVFEGVLRSSQLPEPRHGLSLMRKLLQDIHSLWKSIVESPAGMITQLRHSARQLPALPGARHISTAMPDTRAVMCNERNLFIARTDWCRSSGTGTCSLSQELRKLKQFLARLRETVNEGKTRVVDAKDGFDFLGVHFWKQPSRRDDSKWFCYCWPSQRSMPRIRDKVKAAIGRDDRPTLQEKLDRLNPILRGWSAYFGWLNSAQHFRKVDQYVTWKLRRCLQAKHQRRRRSFWKTPLAFWRKAGLYSTQGRIVHKS